MQIENSGDKKQLIKDRIENFLGYGNLRSDLWFIGPEEGGNEQIEKMLLRISRTYGQKVMDIQSLLNPRWFGQKAPIQSTWGKLIRILLAMKDSKPTVTDKERVRDFQKNNFARNGSDHAILDLMPLPSKSQSEWIYGELAIPSLETKERYKQVYLPKRIKLFQKEISTHNPLAVIFYSFGNRLEWSMVCGGEFHEIPLNSGIIYHYRGEKTNFFVIPHPVATGLTSVYWFEVGQSIKTTLHAGPSPNRIR